MNTILFYHNNFKNKYNNRAPPAWNIKQFHYISEKEWEGVKHASCGTGQKKFTLASEGVLWQKSAEISPLKLRFGVMLNSTSSLCDVDCFGLPRDCKWKFALTTISYLSSSICCWSNSWGDPSWSCCSLLFLVPPHSTEKLTAMNQTQRGPLTCTMITSVSYSDIIWSTTKTAPKLPWPPTAWECQTNYSTF